MIRDATSADLPALTDVYNSLGVATTASYDLTEASTSDRALWLASHTVVVAEVDGHVVGYAAHGQFRSLAGYDATRETSVYVHPEHQGRGLGRRLMQGLIERARASGVHALVAVIDADNVASKALHADLGFVDCGTLPEVGRKFEHWLSVTLMVLSPLAG